jgi:hypothetical protein
MWDFWSTSGSETGFSKSIWLLPVSFHQFFTLNFIYEKKLLLAEGQTGEAWKRSRKRSFFGNREVFDRKVLSVFFLLKGLTFKNRASCI